MKNLYKKICVVVLSGMVLAGGALVSNSSVSNSYSVKQLVDSILGSSLYYSKYLGKNHKIDKGDQVFIIEDPFFLYDLIDNWALRSGIYNIKGEFFFIAS